MSHRLYSVAFVIGVVLFAASFAAGIYRTLRIHQRMPSIFTDYWDELTPQIERQNQQRLERPNERKRSPTVALLRVAAQIDHGQARPFRELWKAASQSGDVDNQIFALKGLVTLTPRDVKARAQLALLLLLQGKLDESEQHSRIALRLEPDFAPAHCNLATALLGRGRQAEAVEHYREALRLDPAMEPARRALRRFAPKGD